MPDYRELPPPARLAAAVECFWTMRPSEAAVETSRGMAGGPGEWQHRVTPDGCADILFSGLPSGGGLLLVGPMTGWRDFPLRAGERLFGMRFRPGMWSGLVGAPPAETTDRLLPLDGVWGDARAGRLAERLAEAPSVERAAEAMADAIPAPSPADPMARALSWMEQRRGLVSMDELAGHAGLSARQLRRVALERTGLPPKFLARVLRFRHAQERLAAGRRGALVEVALDCGYYDQAHFIHEFREFSGRTPATDAARQPGDGRFFQSPPSPYQVRSGS